MGTTSSFFGGSSGGATAAATISTYSRFKRLELLNTAGSISLVNGYINGKVYLVGMNDTHFVANYINNNSSVYLAKLFRVNDDYSVTGIGNWREIITSSPGDLDGIMAGNGYRSVYIATQQSGNSRMVRFDWDGSTGTSNTNRINQAGVNVALNNASCLADGTLVGQLSSNNSGGTLYFCSDSLKGQQFSSSYGHGYTNTQSKSGSVGMENTINCVGITSTTQGRYWTLYRGNNGTLAMNEVDCNWNQSYVYNPTTFRIVRSGNRVVGAIQNNDIGKYGNTMLEGYGNGSTNGGSWQWCRFNAGRDYQTGYGLGDTDNKSHPCNDVEGGSYCRQYNGTYLDRGYIADFGEDTRFSVSYPFKYLQHQSSTADHDSAQGQCIIGDKLIQCQKFGTSNGSMSIEFDIWKTT